MQQVRNYYAVLGISPKASQKEIKAAYHRLARKFHPDINPGDPNAEEHLKEINAAYEVLRDTQKRTRYDYTAPEPGPRRSYRRRRTYRQEARRRERQWQHWYSRTSGPAKHNGKYTAEELNQFVFSQLRQHINREIIIDSLSQKAGFDWWQAASFVRYAEVIHRVEINRRKRQMAQAAANLSTSMLGMLLNLMVVVVFFDAQIPANGCASVIVLIGSAMFVGGLSGTIRTFSEMR